MSVYELDRMQMDCLKQRHMMLAGHDLSWGELANIGCIVSDDEMYREYEGVVFYEDDF